MIRRFTVFQSADIYNLYIQTVHTYTFIYTYMYSKHIKIGSAFIYSDIILRLHCFFFFTFAVQFGILFRIFPKCKTFPKPQTNGSGSCIVHGWTLTTIDLNESKDVV